MRSDPIAVNGKPIRQGANISIPGQISTTGKLNLILTWTAACWLFLFPVGISSRRSTGKKFVLAIQGVEKNSAHVGVLDRHRQIPLRSAGEILDIALGTPGHEPLDLLDIAGAHIWGG